MWNGKVEIKSPMLFVLGFFGIFIIGGSRGLCSRPARSDLQVHDTFLSSRICTTC